MRNEDERWAAIEDAPFKPRTGERQWTPDGAKRVAGQRVDRPVTVDEKVQTVADLPRDDEVAAQVTTDLLKRPAVTEHVTPAGKVRVVTELTRDDTVAQEVTSGLLRRPAVARKTMRDDTTRMLVNRAQFDNYWMDAASAVCASKDCDRHGSDPVGDRRDQAGTSAGSFEVDVAHVARLYPASITTAARLDVFAANQPRPSHGRHDNVRYLLELSEQAHRTGAPVVRPLFFGVPEDTHAWIVDDQFLLRPDILVAPVTDAGTRSRTVYLPVGALWTDTATGEFHEGGTTLDAPAPLDRIPVFVREGAAVADAFAEITA